MAKIRNKKTGKVIEVNDKDLHQYGLGGKKLPKALLGKKQHGDSESMYNQGNYDNMQLLPERTDFGQIGNFNKIGGSGMDNPQINLGNTQPNFYDFNTGQYPNTQLPTGYQPNYTYPAQDYGELDESEYSNGQYQQKRPQEQTYQMDKLPTQLIPEQQAPQFRPLSEDTENTKSGFNWKNGMDIASKSNQGLRKLQMATKDGANYLINKNLEKRENFRNATQFGQSPYADAENRPQGQIYGKDIRGGNALFANGGINLKELYTPETNKANIEVEKNEFISIPHMDNGGHSGLSEKVNFGGSHGEITNGSSGTPMNLPANTLVFSVQNKVKKTPLLAPLLEDGLLKAGDIGKPWSSVANKFKTVDDVNRKENKFSDSIQKTTADMLINMKQAKQKRLFEEGQEPEKLYGFQGKKAQLEAIQSLQQEQQMQPGQTQIPIGKNGMKLPKYGGGGLTPDELSFVKSFKQGADASKVKDIAKKLRADKDLSAYWSKSGAPGGFEGFPGLTDEELISTLATDSRVSSYFNNQIPTTQPTILPTFTGLNPTIDQSNARNVAGDLTASKHYLPYDNGDTPNAYGSKDKRTAAIIDFNSRFGLSVDPTDPKALLKIRNFQFGTNPVLAAHYKENFARGNNAAYADFQKSTGYKKSADKETESQNFFNWAKKNKGFGKDYPDDGLWGHEYFNKQHLNQTVKDFFKGNENQAGWGSVKDIDGITYYFDKGAYDPADINNPKANTELNPITYYYFNEENATPDTKQPTSDPVAPTDYKFTNKAKQQDFDMPNINMGIPLPYNEKTTPLNYYKIQPEFIDPRYLNVQPQLNDITRGVRTVQNNLGDRSTSSVGNSLQAQINAYGQENQVYGNKYNYDKGQDSQAQQFNAQAKMTTDQYNQNSWYNQLEDPIRARSSAKNKQFKENQQRGLENWNEQMAFNNNSNYINDTFYNPRNIDNINWGANLNPVDVKKAKESKWNDEIEKEQYIKQKKAELGIAKNGGKVRIKPKIKLK